MAKLWALVMGSDGYYPTFIQADTIRITGPDSSDSGDGVIIVGSGDTVESISTFEGPALLQKRLMQCELDYAFIEEELQEFLSWDSIDYDDDQAYADLLYHYYGTEITAEQVRKNRVGPSLSETYQERIEKVLERAQERAQEQSPSGGGRKRFKL